jgi:hypothetical protein
MDQPKYEADVLLAGLPEGGLKEEATAECAVVWEEPDRQASSHVVGRQYRAATEGAINGTAARGNLHEGCVSGKESDSSSWKFHPQSRRSNLTRTVISTLQLFVDGERGRE